MIICISKVFCNKKLRLQFKTVECNKAHIFKVFSSTCPFSIDICVNLINIEKEKYLFAWMKPEQTKYAKAINDK